MPKLALLITAIVLFLLSYVSSFYFYVNPSVGYEKKRLEKYIHNQEKDFQEFLGDSALIRKLIQKRESLEEFKNIAEKEYGIFLFTEFLFEEHELFFWSNQKILPPISDHLLLDGEYFQQLANGYYVVVKRTLQLAGIDNKVVAYAMLPVMYKFDFQHSKYLRTQFQYDEDAINKIFISNQKTNYLIQSLSKKALS